MSHISPDEVILGLLQAAPSYGYELLNRFRDSDHLGRIWNMSTSQIYAVLKRLESETAITGQPIPQPDAPPRMEYRLTPKGQGRLTAWLADPNPPVSIHRIRVVFLSRLYIATLLHLPTIDIIQRQSSVCERQLEKIQTNIESSSSPVEILTLKFVAGQLEAALDWLDHCKKYPLVIPDGEAAT
ncbi:MAG: PadR family transcriptional regulator [Anaerolineaceae bacterium]|nr:PadR family transcriptional regulator [Anaerolineaceae bacterium]